MKRIFQFILIVLCAFSVCSINVSATEEDHSMNIYGIFLSLEGDVSLIESDGKWLLIDTGLEECSDELLQKLSSYGIEELDVLISHLHYDHTGGFAALADSDIVINHLYLPDAQLTPYDENTASKQSKLTESAALNNPDVSIIELEKDEEFSFGKVHAKVLGPVSDLTPDDFEETDTQTPLEQYVNCRSLTVRFDCGEVSYITAGDIEEEEERALLEAYKDTEELNADIMKLSHHALYTSNTEEFLAAVSPKYSYALNSNKTINEGSNYRMYYSSCENASKYGPVYLVGDEQEDFKAVVSNGKIDIFKGTEELKGLVSLTGGDGTVVKNNLYYITGDEITEGVYTIDGEKYYIFDGGLVNKAFYSFNLEKYVYRYEPIEGGDVRYFDLDGIMYTGFCKINDNYFYFDTETGLLLKGSEDFTPVSIGQNKYAINENGAVYNYGADSGAWKNYNSSYRYFDSDGVMKTGWLTVNDKKYYLDPSTGFRLTGLHEIDGKTYYFVEKSNAAYAYSSGWKTFDSDYRYFDSDGVMKTGWLTVNDKKYYLDPSTGFRLTGLHEIDGKTYYFVEKSNAAYAYSSGWKTFDSDYRYFDSDGVMKTGWLTVNGKKYYLDKSTGFRLTGLHEISGKTYYFVEKNNAAYMYNSGWKSFDSNYRYFGSDGVMKTGWLTVNDKRYYLDKETGLRVTGFFKDGSDYYYVKNGVRSSSTGFVKYDDKYYKIEKGVRVTTATFKKYNDLYLRLSKTKYTYDGEVKKPSVKVYNSKGNSISSKNYSVTYASGRKKVGEYKVTVKFKNKYSGIKNLYFKICPQSTTISSISAAKESLKVTVKKKSTQITGYQIQYSTSKSFKSASKKTISSYKTTSATIKGLKAEKTYYVRVRTYKTVDGEKFYSDWSEYMSKKTK